MRDKLGNSGDIRSALESVIHPGTLRVMDERSTNTSPPLRVHTCQLTVALRPPHIEFGSADSFKQPKGPVYAYFVSPCLDEHGDLLDGFVTRPVFPEFPERGLHYLAYVGPGDNWLARRNPHDLELRPMSVPIPLPSSIKPNSEPSPRQTRSICAFEEPRRMRSFPNGYGNHDGALVRPIAQHAFHARIAKPSPISIKEDEDTTENSPRMSDFTNLEIIEWILKQFLGMTSRGTTEDGAEADDEASTTSRLREVSESSSTSTSATTSPIDLEYPAPQIPYFAYPSDLPGIPPLPTTERYVPQETIRVCNPLTLIADNTSSTAFNAGPLEKDWVAPLKIVKDENSWKMVENPRVWWKKMIGYDCVDGGDVDHAVDPAPLESEHKWEYEDFALTDNHDKANPFYQDPKPTALPVLPPPEKLLDQGDVMFTNIVAGRTLCALEYMRHFSLTLMRDAHSRLRVPFSEAEWHAFPGPQNRVAIANGKATFESEVLESNFSSRASDNRKLRILENTLDARPLEFETQQGSVDIAPEYLPVNYQRPLQTSLARTAQYFYVDLESIFDWHLYQELAVGDFDFILNPIRVSSLMITNNQVRRTLDVIRKTIKQMGMTEEIDRYGMRPGFYLQQHLTTNPLFSEGEINYLFGVLHAFKKRGLTQLTDLLEAYIMFPIPNPGIVRILRLLGVLNIGDTDNCACSIDTPAVRTHFDFLIEFQRRLIPYDFEQRQDAFRQLFRRSPQYVEMVFNSESYFPRRPNAVLSYEDDFVAAYRQENREVQDQVDQYQSSSNYHSPAPISSADSDDLYARTHGVADSL